MEPRAPRPMLPIVVTIVWGALLIPGLIGAALSPMFFDAPGSMDNPIAYLNVFIVISFPCLSLLAIAGSWIAWSIQKRATAPVRPYAQLAIAALPLLPVAYVVVAMAIGFIGVLASGQPLGLHSTLVTH